MPETLLSYLTRPNPRISRKARGPVKYTFNSLWFPIENLEPWTEFNYQNLVSLFSPDLSRQVDLDDPTPQCEASMFSQLYDEEALGHVVASSIMIPVSCALPEEVFLSSGGITSETDECRPDWSGGNKLYLQGPRNSHGGTNTSDRPKAIILGDTKNQWSHAEAIEKVQRSLRRGYEYNRPHEIYPLEQIQYYCAMYRCRFGFLITEEGLLVLQAFQDIDIQRSPRPQRNVRQLPHQRVTSSSTNDISMAGTSDDRDTQQSPGPQRNVRQLSHQRVTSSSANDTSMAGKSDDHSVTSTDLGPFPIRLMQYAFVPWDAHGVGNVTIKLALYCISRMANEDSRLKPDYLPLASMAQMGHH
ncbi:hypothetical protein DTO271G3_4954 [Paecilomyces variotii]|nr:hypothetical protein DTO271G3_4954 [Paecilomyces variotii]